MAAGRHLPDLSTLVRGCQRRRGGGPRGDHRAPRPPREPAGRGDLAHRRSSRPRWPTSATTSPTTATSTRSSARSRTSTSWSPQCHARDIRLDARLGPEPQLRPAPVVRRVALEPRQPQARLVHVARPGEAAAQRLGVGVQGVRRRVDARRDDGPVLPAQLHARAARPQLGEPGGRGRDARHDPLLVRPRRRRPAPGRDRQDRQGPAAARPGRARPSATTRTGSRSTASCAASARSSTNTTTA